MEKINIAQLLKDCPQGMELDCTLCDDVVFERIDFSSNYPIAIKKLKTTTTIYLTKYGQYINEEGYKCTIFPKGKTTWEGFVPPYEFKKESEDERIRESLIALLKFGLKDGSAIAPGFNKTKEQALTWLEKQGKHLENYDEAEKEKTDFVGDDFIECHADFLDFKKGNTYWLEYIGDDKYNVRSDNLLGKTYHITPCQLYTIFKKLTWLGKQSEQKLSNKVKPKFKVGDRIKHKTLNKNYTYEISEICDNSYKLVGLTWVIHMKYQDDYELIPDKFDISTLVPFESKVLIRSNETTLWRPAIFGFYKKDYSAPYFVVGGNYWPYCIPYKGNEHLLCTTDDCNDFYKTW